MATTCDGTGVCLRQDDLTYTKNPNIECERNCKVVECVNFVVCGKKRPHWVLSLAEGKCPDCNEDGLEIGDVVSEECCECKQTKDCITLVTCKHIMCIDDFRTRWYRRNNRHSRPPPVMPEKNYGKEFAEWNKLQAAWEDEQEALFIKETYIDLCPVCKKNIRQKKNEQ